MAMGQVQAAVALYEEDTRYDWRPRQTHLQAHGASYRLQGRKTLVLQGDSADLLLVSAKIPSIDGAVERLCVVAVPANTPGVQVQGFDTLDGRRAARVEFTDVAVDADSVLSASDDTEAAIEAMLDATNAALCAEALGGVEALLELTAEHLRTRKQFGSPLAKFQVLQHQFADMVIALEQLKSMASAAAMAVAAGGAVQRRRLVSAAKVLASQQGRRIGMQAIQMHGAMGMTDECRVGHYAKRLMVIGQLFGDAAWHLQQLVHVPSRAHA